jgi:hypothetical protein
VSNWIDVLMNEGMEDTLEWKDSPMIGRQQFGLTLPAQAFGLSGEYRFDVHTSHWKPEGAGLGGGAQFTPMFRWYGEGEAPNGDTVILLQDLINNNPESPKGAAEMKKMLKDFYKEYNKSDGSVIDTLLQNGKDIFEE